MKLRCNFPFEYLFVGLRHEYTTCCCCWVPPEYRATVPNVTDAWQLWNHPAFVGLRSRVLNQDWGACTACPRITLGHVHPGVIPAEWTPVMAHGPKTIVLGNDRTCNLCCHICRERPITDAGDPTVATAQRAILDAFLPTAEQISLSHSGDPFVSPIHRDLLYDMTPEKFPSLKVELFTNGQRVSREWNDLPCRTMIHRVMVSIDAGTPDTYYRVRGGRWDRLIDGLAVLRDEKQRRPLDLWINMTVHAENWQDIPAFIELGREFHADRIEIKPVLPHWHSPEDFAQMDVTNSSHPSFESLNRMVTENADILAKVDSAQLLSRLSMKMGEIPTIK